MGNEYIESDDFKEHEQHIKTMYQLLDSIVIPPKANVLDVGGGQGMHACFMAQNYSLCYCLDIIDYQELYDGQYYKLFKEKCERNGVNYDDRSLRFVEGDAMNILFRDEYFDFVTSFNAFEHIPEPLEALQEMVRVTKAGGIIYITFDPVWTADSGGHFIHRVTEPWGHLIYDTETYIEKMKESGAAENEITDFKYAMNQIRLSNHHDNFNKIIKDGNVELLHKSSWSGLTNPDYDQHPNYKKCLDLGYSDEELRIRGLCYIFRKV